MADIPVLIERWKAGDQRAAESLYNHHRQRAFRLAYGLLGNANDAEEATQDALTYALTNIARYNPKKASFSTWLHTITVSRCRDRQRKRRLPQLSLTTWLKWGGDVSDDSPNQERQAIQKDIQSNVLEAVHKLKPPLREAVLLRYWAGHTYREMAAIINCPIPTAQSRVRLAYQHLRTELNAADMAELGELDEERAR